MATFQLDYAFQAGDFRLTGITGSAHNAPGSDPIVPASTGFWLTVHGAGGAQIHSQILRDPRTGGSSAGGALDQGGWAFVPDPGADGFVVFHMAFPAPGETRFNGARVAVFALKPGLGLSILDKLLKAFRKPRTPVWLLILGDGFSPPDAPLFDSFAADVVARLSAMAPFDLHAEALKAAIVARVGPPTPNGAFGWKVQGLTGRLLMQVERTKVMAYVAQQLKLDPVNVLVVLNDHRYGGSGGDPAVTGFGEDSAQGRANAIDAAIHELGHSGFALADEYDSPVPGMDTTPVELNVARDEVGVRSKWGAVLDPQDGQLPTDPATATATTVGMFQGAKYATGNCRAQLTCRMRQVDQPFCAACREVIASVLESEL